MTKAFDKADLLLKLKAKGLDVAEELVKVLVEETLIWIEESVVLSESKVDDIAVPIIAGLKPFVMSQVDKIDGAVG